MDNENSLKNWVRKHSPLRPKPLPAPRTNKDDPHLPRPLDPVSANISPSRRPSKSRLRSLLKHKTQAFDDIQVDETKREKQLRRQSMPVMAPPIEHHPALRRSEHNPGEPTDLHRLSMKISNLEAQLKEAKNQLDNAARYSSESSWAQPPPLSRQSSIRQITTDQPDTSANLLETELMHDLLAQTERDFSTRSLLYRSSTDISLGPEYQDSYDTATNDNDHDHDSSYTSPNQHKRKRSQLRQASWEQVQSQLLERQSRCIRQNPPDPKRARKERGRSHSLRRSQSKDLPDLPLFPMPSTAVISHPDFFAVVDPAEEAEGQHPYPPLDRHQRHLSQPPPSLTSSPDRPKATKHRRSKSQIIDTENVRQALAPANADSDGATAAPSGDSSSPLSRPPSRKGGAGGTLSRPVNPPSPNRRRCQSPIRLERVQEEFEWDEDIF